MYLYSRLLLLDHSPFKVLCLSSLYVRIYSVHSYNVLPDSLPTTVSVREDNRLLYTCLSQYTLFNRQYQIVLRFYFKITEYGEVVVRISRDITLKQFFFKLWIEKILKGTNRAKKKKFLKFTYKIF
jgi:hypothetical protein